MITKSMHGGSRGVETGDRTDDRHSLKYKKITTKNVFVAVFKKIIQHLLVQNEILTKLYSFKN